MLRALRRQESDVVAWGEKAARIEERVREKMRRHEPISKNVEVMHQEQLTFGQRVSDGLAKTAGSWAFIFGFAVVLLVWVSLNTLALIHHWDAYPYILLNLILSMLAAIQAPVIMMSQNRQDKKDRLRSELDYAVNRQAEAEIQGLAHKLNLLGKKIDDVQVLLREKTPRTVDSVG